MLLEDFEYQLNKNRGRGNDLVVLHFVSKESKIIHGNDSKNLKGLVLFLRNFEDL